MVATINLKFYSKLQFGISKYQEKTPAHPLNTYNTMTINNKPNDKEGKCLKL